MFPIVPQNYELKNQTFTNPELISNFVTGASKLLVPGKVTAFCRIPEGTVSRTIDAVELMGQPDIVQISAQLNTLGVMDLEKKSKEMWDKQTHWVRALRLSDDCHSYNVQLKFESKPSENKYVTSSRLILQAVKPIEIGQELLLWFSEDVLALLQITFLTPANIQGQKRYVCTKCSALYESPNPLKLHISLSCGRYSITHLWEKLAKNLSDSSFLSPKKEDTFDFKLSPEPHILRQKSAIDLSVSSSNCVEETNENDLYRPYTSVNSAFKPFKKIEDSPISHRDSLLVPVEENMWPLSSFEHNMFNLQQSGEEEAQIETFVSSLGKSKQGHICLYCGKCYSRKYGLKIHIRTHTGYKPLKCKYCLRPFGDPSNLNKHVRLHAEGNTPYKCDLCGKILVRRRDLDRHLKSRHMIEMHPELNLLQDQSSPQNSEKAEAC